MQDKVSYSQLKILSKAFKYSVFLNESLTDCLHPKSHSSILFRKQKTVYNKCSLSKSTVLIREKNYLGDHTVSTAILKWTLNGLYYPMRPQERIYG